MHGRNLTDSRPDLSSQTVLNDGEYRDGGVGGCEGGSNNVDHAEDVLCRFGISIFHLHWHRFIVCEVYQIILSLVLKKKLTSSSQKQTDKSLEANSFRTLSICCIAASINKNTASEKIILRIKEEIEIKNQTEKTKLENINTDIIQNRLFGDD
ncbi:unnamed protein product [Wuchereria bancrofti]|uniref:Uncharacterized protein n=1 Tax=Wuchereria bancrofti TaxID=6293 RepID=A0A3P7G9B1_WUCBA|nr:unnamed protein product [Wuchereria bancrofti]